MKIHKCTVAIETCSIVTQHVLDGLFKNLKEGEENSEMRPGT